MTGQEQIKIGVCVLVEKEGKFLFGKRKNMFGEGFWGVPGGHLDPHETLQGGAKRELQEETGLIADELELVSILNQPNQTNNNHHYIQFVFLAKQYHGEVENKEPDYCEGWEWFGAGQLPEPLFGPHKNFVSAYVNKRMLIDPDQT